MKAFLSYSSKDAYFVREVTKLLGAIQCEFDEKTFDFTLNAQAIRTALVRSDIYVFFYRKARSRRRLLPKNSG